MFPMFWVVFSLNVSMKLDITKLDTTKSPYYSIWQAAESCNVFFYFLKKGHLVHIKVAWNYVLFTPYNLIRLLGAIPDLLGKERMAQSDANSTTISAAEHERAANLFSG